MQTDRPRIVTLGADKGYDAEDFANERTVRHSGYAVSLRIGKRIEVAFGWIKTVDGQRKTRFEGLDRVGWPFTFAAAACNLVRCQS